jgi:hypothetical protein
MPLASTFMDEETMDGCIRKALNINIPMRELIMYNISDIFSKNIRGPEKGRFTLLVHTSKERGFEITKYRNCSNYEFCIWTFRQIMSHQYRINQNIWKTKKPKDVKG